MSPVLPSEEGQAAWKKVAFELKCSFFQRKAYFQLQPDVYLALLAEQKLLESQRRKRARMTFPYTFPITRTQDDAV